MSNGRALLLCFWLGTSIAAWSIFMFRVDGWLGVFGCFITALSSGLAGGRLYRELRS